MYLIEARKVLVSADSDVPVVYHMNLELAVVTVPAAAFEPNVVAVLACFQTAVYAVKPVVTSKDLSVVKSPAIGMLALVHVLSVKVAVVVAAICAIAHSHKLAAF